MVKIKRSVIIWWPLFRHLRHKYLQFLLMCVHIIMLRSNNTALSSFRQWTMQNFYGTLVLSRKDYAEVIQISEVSYPKPNSLKNNWLLQYWFSLFIRNVADRVITYDKGIQCLQERPKSWQRSRSVIMYIKDCFNHKEIAIHCAGDMECIAVKWILSSSMSFNVVGVYRPPSSNMFYEN